MSRKVLTFPCSVTTLISYHEASQPRLACLSSDGVLTTSWAAWLPGECFDLTASGSGAPCRSWEQDEPHHKWPGPLPRHPSQAEVCPRPQWSQQLPSLLASSLSSSAVAAKTTVIGAKTSTTTATPPDPWPAGCPTPAASETRYSLLAGRAPSSSFRTGVGGWDRPQVVVVQASWASRAPAGVKLGGPSFARSGECSLHPLRLPCAGLSRCFSCINPRSPVSYPVR